MILEHKHAILAALNADAILASCGHEGVVQVDPDGKRPDRYWTIFVDSGLRSSTRLGGMPTEATLRYTFHCIGRVPEQAQRLAERIVTCLAGAQLDVPGYSPHRIRHVASQTTQLDATTKPPYHYTVDGFEWPTQTA